MIILVVVAPTVEKYEKSNGMFDMKRRLEKISGEPCLVLHNIEVTYDLIDKLRPRAMILSGFGYSFSEFDPRSFFQLEEVIKMTDLPILAICGSHQLIGFMYNLDLHSIDRLEDQPMRKLLLGEVDLADYHPGYFKEYGFYPVDIVRDDEIFEGLPNPFIVREAHYCEIKNLPHDFVLLASTKDCRIQAMKHRSRTIYSTQFHPEGYTEFYQHGKIFLENFFKIAFRI
jgi:GMP synthase (glutamine-hydrolysing)